MPRDFDQIVASGAAGGSPSLTELATVAQHVQTVESGGRTAVTQEAPLNLQWPEYEALKDGDDWGDSVEAFLADLATGGEGIIPNGEYDSSSPIVIREGMDVRGLGSPGRWRPDVVGTKINYTGTGAALVVQPGAGEKIDGGKVRGLCLDGAGLANGAAIDGLFVDATAGGGDVYVEGFLVEDVLVKNFPRNQARFIGEAFDLTLRRLGGNNEDRAAEDVFYSVVGAEAPSQLTFEDCWATAYTSGKCSYLDEGSGTARFFAGDFATAHTGAHGIRKTNGGTFIFGTHLEGIPGATGKAIEVSGNHGGIILPSRVVVFDIGVHIGNSATPAASACGFIVGGTIDCTTSDVKISAGGERDRTVILPIGQESGAAPTIDNQRASSDGVFGEVANWNAIGQTLGAAATDAATTQTLANNIRTALINLGLGKT